MFDLYDAQGTWLRTARSGRNLRAPDGTTITDASALPVAILNAAGVYPVADPGRPDDRWQAVTGPTRRIIDGRSVWRWQTGALAAADYAARLESLRAEALTAVDAAAEAARGAYLTEGAGQAMTYLRKEARAREAQARIDAGTPPSAGDYPMLAAEVGITAPDLAGVVAIVIAQSDAWEAVATAIEAARLSGKASIAAATTAEAVATARDTALAALDALRAGA